MFLEINSAWTPFVRETEAIQWWLNVGISPSGSLLYNDYLFYQRNSLAVGRCGHNLKSIIFKLIIQNSSLDTVIEMALSLMPQSPHKWEVCIGSGNGLVPY